ncbi:uroporphyrinogen-III C-methyltransferase [Fodinibius salsisoli]|uniref:uroporphyrinogen-III C-methyltransferase n=1 Tax=Fodinibius salsisoli TaxID=2820877 RepID=A0ABT3PQ79_9BACT|nr:uroporphyrinogen-III C-methyltransferase [Fodinibius salsisoli]MCW9708014.1 uroporphyrinogen-III C-methyltransferase [Fodinibius salsisoli]
MSVEAYHNYGKVYLVGAGPGDPELITVKGARILSEADTIVYDRLANPELLSMTSEKSEHIYVGKRPDKPSVSQEQINHILVTKAGEGKTIARLKGGDPFVFGRGGEECEVLRSKEIPYEVVPGISSSLAAPAYAGIPVTHRKVARSFTVVTGHTIKNTETFTNWEHLVHSDTLVVLMGTRSLPQITEKLIKHGKDPQTPVGIVEKASYSSQRTTLGTLGTIVDEATDISSPGTIVIGELAAKSHELAWFQTEDAKETTVSNSRLRTQFVG